jgi:xanthine dehydrogenase accessory factor
MDLMKKTVELINNNKKCVLATVVEKQGEGPLAVGGKLIIDEAGNRFGTIAGGDLELNIIEQCKTILKTKENQLLLYNLSNRELMEDNIDAEMICGGTARIFFEYFEPQPKLIVFGGSGNVGKEICEKSQGLGFNLVIVDRKQSELSIPHIYFDYNASILASLDITAKDYVVIAMGNHAIDYEVIKMLTQQSIQMNYCGMLASKTKAKELIERMNDEIEKTPVQLFSPIGLTIGGETPPEIAISVLSQIQKHRYAIDNVEDMGVI